MLPSYLKQNESRCKRVLQNEKRLNLYWYQTGDTSCNKNNKGKSGGIRVIYVDFEIYEKIYLLTAYTKNEKDNLSNEERNEIRKLITVLENQLNDNF